MLISSSGLRTASSASTGARWLDPNDSGAASRSRPVASPCRLSASRADCESATIRSANGRKSCPASVSDMPRVVRASSGVPSSASSRASRRLIIDFDIPSRAPARVRLPVCATSAKARMSSMSGIRRSASRKSLRHIMRLPSRFLATSYWRGQTRYP